ncbi:MAG: thioredoxin [Dehalococcoidia bacterium]|nr:thioredoxin [Chloroflexota bacterium]MCZ6866403.1 thioredoxin [Chloroflexota bacterium]
MAKPFAVTDAEFDEKVIKADKPVLVDFWAEWCVPCKIIAPIVDELAEEMDGQMEFAKVDVDSSPITAVTYGIRSIPALLIFKGGKPVEQIIGAIPKGQLKKKIEEALAA